MVQVKITFSELVPASGPNGPSGEQTEVAPLMFHVTEPPGAVAPTIPVTVAVNVMVLPNTGVAGEVVMAIVGVAFPTTTESGEVIGSGAKFPSP